MKQMRWQCGMLVPERYARKVAGEAFEQHAEFFLENGREAELEIRVEFKQDAFHHCVRFSIDLNELSESTWPIVFANTPIFGNFSISVRPAASFSVLDKIGITLANRSLLKSELREEILRVAFVDAQVSLTTSAGDFIEPLLDHVIVNGARIERGSTVRLHPRRGADVWDLFLEGKTATVQAVHQDFDNRQYIAVTVDDDPAGDLHEWHGRSFFFYPDEIEA